MAESKERVITLADLKEHKTAKSLWVSIHGNVYDITGFLEEQPGGEEALMEVGGEESTEEFEDIGHSADARELMTQYKIGVLADPKEKEQVGARVLLPQMCNLCSEAISEDFSQLSCSHSFCKKCLGKFVNTFMKNDMFSCCVCGTAHNICDVDLGESSEKQTTSGRHCETSGHSNLEMQLYCKDHGKCICAKCFQQSHKDCNVPDVYEEAAHKQSEMKELRQKLGAYEEQIVALEKKTVDDFTKARNDLSQLESQAVGILLKQKAEAAKLTEHIEEVSTTCDPWAAIEGGINVQDGCRNLLSRKLYSLNFTCSLEDATSRTEKLDTEQPSSRTVELTGILNIPLGIIKFIFSSKESHGGKIEKLTRDGDRTIITFEESKVAKRVAERGTFSYGGIKASARLVHGHQA